MTNPMSTPDEISVLLVEDDEDDYFLTLDLFESIDTRNFVVTWADNVETAISELQSGKHDICLIDYRLGPVTGVEVLESCREALRSTPAIVLTGAHSAEVDDAASKAGASDYLVKGDLTAAVLERAVRYVLQRSDSDARIEYLAFHDPLTDLPNRLLFSDRVTQALARVARNEEEVFVIFFDIDHFKDINDTQGHAAGDQLLTQLAHRLRNILRPSDTLARLGGDEFAMCIEGCPTKRRAEAFIARAQQALALPFVTDSGGSVVVTASFGVASTINTSMDPEELLRNADIAMYQAKRVGRNTWSHYERSMHEQLERRIALERDLVRAVNNGDLEVHYQPFVSLSTGEVVGFEALCRWDHAARGAQSPAEFVGLAEESGLIVQLGDYVMNTAARAATEWRQAHGFEGFVSVNVSPHQIADSGFVDSLVRTLDQTGMQPEHLVIEFTETIMTGDIETVVSVLDKIAELGLGIALDDFGTGYSSLSNVHLLPISILKVDRSFVLRHQERKGLSMLKTIATMASSLGVAAIAEGIETDEQLECLRALGFPIGQGFLFDKALSADKASELLAGGSQYRVFQ